MEEADIRDCRHRRRAIRGLNIRALAYETPWMLISYTRGQAHHSDRNAAWRRRFQNTATKRGAAILPFRHHTFILQRTVGAEESPRKAR